MTAIYRVRKRCEIAGSHRLSLPYESPCSRPHGHNWIVTFDIESKAVNSRGMVIDFSHLSTLAKRYDHRDLNECEPFASYELNPTAENLARALAEDTLQLLHQAGFRDDDILRVAVSVQESEGNTAEVVL